MKKLQFPKGFVLTGTDNNGFRHRYSAIKNEQFKKIFIKFMIDLGFDEKEMGKTFFRYGKEENLIELKISELEDMCKHYENKMFEIDVFYGSKKIILVIRTKARRPLLDNLETKSRWIKVLKVKKINNKRIKTPLLTHK